MPTIREQQLSFSFPPSFRLARYETWHPYKEVLRPRATKAVDIVAFRRRNPPPPLWLIEVKDFRELRGGPGEKNDRKNLPANVVRKAADTLFGLRDAAVSAEVVVLHMEPFRGPSRLFPEQPTRSNVLQKMKQLLKAYPDLDQNPLVLDLKSTPRAKVPWTVAPVPY